MVIGVLFTRGVSLKVWLEKGLLYREKQLYEAFLFSGNATKIYWFTYGVDDMGLAKSLYEKQELDPRIVIVPMPNLFFLFKSFAFLYALLLPIIHYKKILKCSFVKSNQADGSQAAWFAKLIFRKYFLFRTGYTLSSFTQKKYGKNLKYLYARLVETISYKLSDAAIVTSKGDYNYVKKVYKKLNLYINYNFIDIKSFKDMSDHIERKNRLLFVGRLSAQKNLPSLLDAIKNLKIGADFYGDGELSVKISALIQSKNIDVVLKGSIKNSDLPRVYNQYKYFILPSLYEGMPKTLIEAMSCRCLCIGTNVSGTNELITDQTGVLVQDVSPSSLQKGILEAYAFNENELQEKTETARRYIKANFSLENHLFNELSIIHSFTKGAPI